MSTLHQHFEPGDRVNGVIDNGGVAPNIIPEYTSARWLIRAATAERFETLKARILACFEAAAKATGCELTITAGGEPYQDLVSNLALVDLFVANSEALGRPMLTYAQTGEEAAASSDMGNVSHVVPSIHPGIGIETGGAVNHQPEFEAATITPSGEKAVRDGALAMAYTIIDMAEQDVWERL